MRFKHLRRIYTGPQAIWCLVHCGFTSASGELRALQDQRGGSIVGKSAWLGKTQASG